MTGLITLEGSFALPFSPYRVVLGRITPVYRFCRFCRFAVDPFPAIDVILVSAALEDNKRNYADVPVGYRLSYWCIGYIEKIGGGHHRHYEFFIWMLRRLNYRAVWATLLTASYMDSSVPATATNRRSNQTSPAFHSNPDPPSFLSDPPRDAARRCETLESRALFGLRADRR